MKVKKALAGAAAALLLSTGALIGAAPQAQAATGGVSMYWGVCASARDTEQG